MMPRTTGRPGFILGGLSLTVAEAPDLIADSLGKAFSMSRADAVSGDVAVHAVFLDDGAFRASLPPYAGERYDAMPGNEDPLAFLGPGGEFWCLVRNSGTASSAVVDPDGRFLRLACQRLTKGKAPLHFQSVLIPALKHLLLQRGKLLLHAGCVAALDGRGLLFAGLSGAGKTTTCIALTRAGFRYISDDLVVLSIQDGKAVVEGIREHMNLTRQTIEFFPEFSRFRRELEKAEHRGKLPVNPETLFGADRMSNQAVIDSIMVIQIGKAGPQLVPVKPPGILNVILQNHTFETGLSIPRQSMDILWSILGTVRTFQLRTGPDPSAMGDHVYREFHGDAPAQPVPTALRKEHARRRKARPDASSAASILRSVLGHTLDNERYEADIPEGAVRLCTYHRLETHLARCMKDAGAARLPDFDPDRVLSNASALALSMEKTVERVHAALDAAGIPALLIRGPAVSKRYYGEESLRFFRDIDLLVTKELLARAAEVLQELGYRPDRDLGYWGKRGEWPFSDGTRIVELHWDAYPSPFHALEGLRGEDMLRSHDTVTVGSATVACLSRGHLLFSSMLHAAYEHHLDRLVRLVDIRQMVKMDGSSLDWDWIAEAVRKTGASIAVVKELECMDRLLPIPVPETWRKDLHANPLWKAAADLVLPDDLIISGRKKFNSLRRGMFRYLLKFSR